MLSTSLSSSNKSSTSDRLMVPLLGKILLTCRIWPHSSLLGGVLFGNPARSDFSSSEILQHSPPLTTLDSTSLCSPQQGSELLEGKVWDPTLCAHCALNLVAAW